jgi:putative copper export protein
VAWPLHAAALLLLMQAVGAMLFLARFHLRLMLTDEDAQRLARTSATAAAVLLLACQLLEPARMAGEWQGLFDARLSRLAWHSIDGLAHAVQATALLLCAALLGEPAAMSRGGRRSLVLVAAVIALAGLLASGHVLASRWRWLLLPLLALHVVVAAFWFGSLLPLHRALREEARVVVQQLLRSFSVLAGLVVPLIALAGVGIALALVCGLPGWTEPYGLALLVKLGAYTVLVGLAAFNRWVLVPRIDDEGRGRDALLQAVILVEWIIISGVLVVTSRFALDWGPGG